MIYGLTLHITSFNLKDPLPNGASMAACSTSMIKVYLFVFNILFFILGIASLVMGIWASVKSELFRVINLADAKISDGANLADINAVANQGGTVAAAGYILIALGFITLVVGFCGCFGAIKESKCLLTTYAVLVSLVFIGQIAVAITAAAFQNRIRTAIVAKIKKLQDNFFISRMEYEKLMDKPTAKVLVTFLINLMQLHLECCGIETVGDITDSPSWKGSNRKYGNRTIEVPLTCCQLKSGTKSRVIAPSYNWSNLRDDLEQRDCPYSSATDTQNRINKQTCFSSLMDFVGKSAFPLIGVCTVIGLIELLGIVFAICFIKSIMRDQLRMKAEKAEKKSGA